MGFNEDPFILLCFSELFTAGSLMDLRNIEGRGNQGGLQVSGGAKEVGQGVRSRARGLGQGVRPSFKLT